MAAKTRDMTSGNPTRLILSFCLPIMAGNLFQQLYSLVDTLVIGQIEGVTALAAVSAAGWLDWLVLGLAQGMAQGFSIQIAQSFGAGDYAEMRRAAGQSVVLSVGIVVVLTALAQGLLWPLLRFLQSPENTIALTCQYLRIIFSGVVFVMGFNLLSGFLRSLGDSRTPLYAMTSAALCNIGLDILFVGAFRWGVTGVAVATTLSQVLSCAICLAALVRMPIMRISRADLRPDRPMMRRLMGLGVPVAFQNLIISVGGLVLQRVVKGFGFVFMAGYNAATRLTGLLELAIGVIACVFGRQFLSLFINDAPELTEQVLRVGCRYLYVASGGLFLLYLLFAYRSTLQGLGDTIIPMASGVVELVMRIGCALLLPLIVGEWGVYIAEIAAWGGAAVFLMWGYYRRMRLLEAQFQQGA